VTTHRVDQLARLLAGTDTRRGLLRFLPVLGLAATLGDAETWAKKKGKKGKAGKKGKKGKSCRDGHPNDCPIDEHCKNGKCVPGCDTDLDCAMGKLCENERCIPGCETRFHCPDGQYCDEQGQCAPGDCGGHFDCEVLLGTRLSRCNFSTHRCERIECIGDSDCIPPKTCRDTFICS
jgi:hypothetical protein